MEKNDTNFSKIVADNFNFASKQLNNNIKPSVKNLNSARLSLIGVQTMSLIGMAMTEAAACFSASALIAGSPIALLGIGVSLAATSFFRDLFIISENLNQGIKNTTSRNLVIAGLTYAEFQSMKDGNTTPYLKTH